MLRLNKLLWAIRYRTTHRYHVINLRVPPGYYDASDQVTLSVFSILEDFMTQSYHHTDWDWHPDHMFAGLTLRRAYKWWQQFKDFDAMEATSFDFIKRTDKYKFYLARGTGETSAHYLAAEDWYIKMCQYWLIEIMKVRMYMWD